MCLPQVLSRNEGAPIPFRPIRRLLRRPSPAMLVALLALAIAMSGSAVAAVLVSSPDQLANAVVTNPKLAIDSVGGRALDEPSVNSDQLHDDAVTNPKLATGAVINRALGTGAVMARALGTGAVTAEKLANPVYSGVIRPDGSVLRSVGVNAAKTSRFGQGQYGVAFDQPVSGCAIATSAFGSFAVPTTSSLGPDTLEIDWLDASTKKFVDTSFSVIVQC